MKDAKPKPRASKLPLREPAKPLATPETRPLSPDHPIHSLLGPLRAAEAPTTHHPPPTKPVAPERDFVRVPNSVVRDAIPGGLFKGESKKTYDALYQRTRGAVVPQRQVRTTLADVQTWAGVSHNTLKAHLKHLSAVGLLRVHYTRGDNTGAEYEVFTPEEAINQTTTHHPPPTTQNLGPPTTQNLVGGGWGQTVDTQGDRSSHNTSFKTYEKNDDDEAFAGLVALLKRASREVTGRESSQAEADRWKEVAELLVTELKVAAARTNVTSAPAFLAEHLRRRLRKADARQIEREVSEAASGLAAHAGPPRPELTHEQIEEQAQLIAGLLRGGAGMGELEEKFAANFRPAQWHQIRSIAMAQSSAAAAGTKSPEG